MKKKYLAIPILVAMSLVIVGAAGVPNSGQETTEEEEGIPYESLVTVRVNGEVVSQSPNTFLSTGQDWLIGQVGDVDSDTDTYGATTHYIDGMRVSDGETDHFDTTDMSWDYDSTGNITVTQSFTADADDKTVDQTTIYDSENSADFAENTFTEVTLQDGDSIDVTWQLWTE